MEDPKTKMKSATITVDSMICVNMNEIGFDLVHIIKTEFTKPNPQYHMMKNSGMRFDERDFPRYIVSYETDKDVLKIPRGTGRWMREFLTNRGFTVSVVDKRVTIAQQIDFSLNYGAKCANGKIFQSLYPYQEAAVGAVSRNQEGMINADCGGGKTLCGIALIDKIKQPTIVFVHTGDLAGQWLKELTEKGKGNFTIGNFGFGQKSISDITIATVQSFSRLSVEEKESMMENFGCVILDECHHAPADSFANCLNHSKAKYRFGLTATPKRSDGLGYLMFDLISRFTYTVTNEQIANSNVRAKVPTVTPVATGYSFNRNLTMASRIPILVGMSENVTRNNKIVDCIESDIKLGYFPLVITQFVDHAKTINERLRSRGLESRLLVGEVMKKERLEIIELARKNQIHAVIATKVADEGLDIPQLDCIHLLIPHSNDTKLQQQIGRIRRSCDGKLDPVVRDYVDGGPYFFKSWARRLKLYRNWGFETNELVV